jgi:hypothetical protein
MVSKKSNYLNGNYFLIQVDLINKKIGLSHLEWLARVCVQRSHGMYPESVINLAR